LAESKVSLRTSPPAVTATLLGSSADTNEPTRNSARGARFDASAIMLSEISTPRTW
jgi:hypothetical protein